MRSIVRLPFYVLITSVLLGSGCVVAPDHDHDRGYHRHDDAESRDHERREAYRHCRETGGHDCDDLSHRDD